MQNMTKSKGRLSARNPIICTPIKEEERRTKITPNIFPNSYQKYKNKKKRLRAKHNAVETRKTQGHAFKRYKTTTITTRLKSPKENVKYVMNNIFLY